MYAMCMLRLDYRKLIQKYYTQCGSGSLMPRLIFKKKNESKLVDSHMMTENKIVNVLRLERNQNIFQSQCRYFLNLKSFLRSYTQTIHKVIIQCTFKFSLINCILMCVFVFSIYHYVLCPVGSQIDLENGSLNIHFFIKNTFYKYK